MWIRNFIAAAILLCGSTSIAGTTNSITSLSHVDYFRQKVCYGENYGLNNKFARGIDLKANANRHADYFDHQKADFIELNQDDFLIGKKLGSGKFSDVYLGYDKTQNLKKIVIKILRPNKLEKIEREISLLQKANPIRNIAHLLGITIDPTYSVPSLVFEFMPGKTLRNILHRFNEIDIRTTAKQLILQVLEETHALGLIHRDIKGGNIIVNHEERQLKIIDWGLSEVYMPDDVIYSKIGTIGYKAPEMLLRDGFYGHFTPAIDIWAAGMCILGMMANKLPLFPSKPNEAILKMVEIFGYERIFRLSSDVSVNLKSAVYQTIAEFPQKYTRNGTGLRSLIKSADSVYAPEIGLDLLNKLFAIDPTDRISASEALQHAYFDPVRDIVLMKNQTESSM